MFGLKRRPDQATDSRCRFLGRGCSSSVCDVRGCSATSPPDLTTPSGPDFTKRAIPTARSIEAALACRYPTNIPAAARSTSPATPGEASAASDQQGQRGQERIDGVLENRSQLLRNQAVRQHRLEPTECCSTAPLAAETARGRVRDTPADDRLPESPGARSISGQPACTAPRMPAEYGQRCRAHLPKGFRRSRRVFTETVVPSPSRGESEQREKILGNR